MVTASGGELGGDRSEDAVTQVRGEAPTGTWAETTERSRRRWWVPGVAAVVIAVVVAALAGTAGYLVVDARDRTWFASTGTLVDQPRAVAVAQDSGVLDKLSRLRLKYAGILRSDAVVDEVADDLDLRPQQVRNAVVATGDTGSLLLLVGARADSRDSAIALSNALARQLRTYIAREQVDNDIAADDRVRLDIVAPARSARVVQPTDRQRWVATAGAAAVGFIATLGIADLLRRRRR